MVHQHFRLVERFTVAENVVLGDRRGAGRRFLIEPGAVERDVSELGERYRLPVDPHAHVWQLSLGEQQRVEIVKALYQSARILILDEPTSVLTPQEAETLFHTLRQMAAEGRTVIFISHKLHEVLAVADRITVLRAGRALATVDAADATTRSLASLMVGCEVETAPRRNDRSTGPVVLELEDVWVAGDRGPPAVKGVTLAVRAGEIVAVAGVSGNGQRELAEAVAGLRRPASGSIRAAGRRIAGDPRDAIDAGVAYVPEDRLGTGVAPSLSISSNLALKSYRRDSFGPLLGLRHMRVHAEQLIGRYGIKARDARTEARNLSGGNLQKLVLAREFDGAPTVLVAASATRGLDVAAVEAVHAYLLEAASRGVGILLISEDLDEVLELGDRILVMYEGQLSEVGSRRSVEEIGLRMAGAAPRAA
jgi:simple sugar transport system ATP-binding protein